MKASIATIVCVACFVVVSAADAKCPEVDRADCSAESTRAQHPELCELSLKGTQAAAELLRRPASADPENACARSWALRQVYRLREPHEMDCEQYLCLFGIEDSHLEADTSRTQVTVNIAFDIESVSLVRNDEDSLIYLRGPEAGLSAPRIVLSLDPGGYTLKFRNQSDKGDERGITVEHAEAVVELGARVAVNAGTIKGYRWEGGEILIADRHDVALDGAGPNCHAYIDPVQSAAVLSADCNDTEPTLTLAPQARADTTFTGAGGMLLVGGAVGMRLERFTFEPRVSFLASGNTKGWAAGVGVGYRVAGPFEVLVGSDLLSAYIDASSAAVWGLYPGLQLRVRGDSGLGGFVSGNVICLFDDELRQRFKTVYPSAGLGVEWRFGL